MFVGIISGDVLGYECAIRKVVPFQTKKEGLDWIEEKKQEHSFFNWIVGEKKDNCILLWLSDPADSGDVFLELYLFELI